MIYCLYNYFIQADAIQLLPACFPIVNEKTYRLRNKEQSSWFSSLGIVSFLRDWLTESAGIDPNRHWPDPRETVTKGQRGEGYDFRKNKISISQPRKTSPAVPASWTRARMTLKYRKVIAQSMLQKNEGLYRLGLRSKVGIGKPKDLIGKAIPLFKRLLENSHWPWCKTQTVCSGKSVLW